ncbi:MAG: insulinase family protein [Chlamydiales bacterium]|nr:insulinase family protein [Chlamydiales bacterium]
MQSDSFLTSCDERYGDYTVKQSMFIEEVNSFFREIIHKPSGATILHFENDNPENLCCIAFQTYPKDDKGACHVLEHMLLTDAAKDKYKGIHFVVKNLNTATFEAYTCISLTRYHALTTSKDDFYTLLKAAIENIFRPCLRENAFFREGCRLELTDPNDINSDLRFNGIVYNEIKQTTSNVDYIMLMAMNKALFPNLFYQYSHIGNPEDITQLTYKDILKTYDKFYHPSNCTFIFHGNLPLQTHLDFLENHLLKNARKRKSPLLIKKQKTIPVSKIIKTSYSSLSDVHHHSIGWSLTLTQEEIIAFHIISQMLEGCVLFDEYSQPIFVRRYCNSSKKGLLDSIQADVNREFTLEDIENAFVSLELDLLEIKQHDNGSPNFIRWCEMVLAAKYCGRSILKALQVKSSLTTLKALLKTNPLYLNNLMKKHLLHNPHYVIVRCVPDKDWDSKKSLKTQSELKRLKEKLSLQEKKNIQSIMEQITATTNEPQASVLSLTSASVSKAINKHDWVLTQEQIRNFQIFHRECLTNKIAYIDYIFNLPQVDSKNISLFRNLPLLLGNDLNKGITISRNISDSRGYQPYFYLRTKVFEHQLGNLSEYFQSIVEFYGSHKTSLKDLSIPSDPSFILDKITSQMSEKQELFLLKKACSGLSLPFHLDEIWNGITCLKNIQKIKLGSSHYPALKKQVYSCPNPHMLITCDQSMLQIIKKELLFDFGNKVKTTHTTKKDLCIPKMNSLAVATSFPVAHVLQMFPTITYNHIDFPVLLVVTSLLSNFLMQQSRYIQGAYRASATTPALQGVTTLCVGSTSSISMTLDTFNQAIKAIARGQFSQSDLVQAQLKSIKRIDAKHPSLAVHTKVLYENLLAGFTMEWRQNIKNHILDITPKQISTVLEKYILSNTDNSIIVAFANKELIKKENKILAKQGRELPVLHLDAI